MGAQADDCFHIVLFESSDVFPGKGLEAFLIAQAAGRVAATRLLLAQYAETHPRRLKDVHHGAGYLLILGMKGPGAAHPKQYLRLAVQAGDMGDLQAQGPVLPVSGALAVGVSKQL